MSDAADVEAAFSAIGGVFLTPGSDLAQRLRSARGLVFDWDGVFNSGAKGEGASSTFAEADSMGANLLRYALWQAHAELPVTAIITGEDNPTARRFAAREHFHAVLSGAKDKTLAIDEFCAAERLRSDQLICIFDDVNDLGMAARCGIRMLVRRDASPLLKEYVARHALCDYITAARAHEYGVREAAELLLGLMGAFERCVRSRVAWDEDYARYFAARQAVETRFETKSAPAPEQPPERS